jgi:hypothetical protein
MLQQRLQPEKLLCNVGGEVKQSAIFLAFLPDGTNNETNRNTRVLATY